MNIKELEKQLADMGLGSSHNDPTFTEDPPEGQESVLEEEEIVPQVELMNSLGMTEGFLGELEGELQAQALAFASVAKTTWTKFKELEAKVRQVRESLASLLDVAGSQPDPMSPPMEVEGDPEEVSEAEKQADAAAYNALDESDFVEEPEPAPEFVPHVAPRASNRLLARPEVYLPEEGRQLVPGGRPSPLENLPRSPQAYVRSRMNGGGSNPQRSRGTVALNLEDVDV